MRCSAHTTGQSAPGRRIGSFGLASSPLVPFPLASKRLVLAIPRKSLCWCHVPYTLVAACPVIRLPAGWSQEIETPLVLTTVLWITPRLRRVHFVRLTNPYLPKVILGLLLQPSRPRLLTAAAWSGLGPAPEGRSRGAYPHLSRSLSTRSSVHCRTPFRVRLQHTLDCPVTSHERPDQMRRQHQ